MTGTWEEVWTYLSSPGHYFQDLGTGNKLAFTEILKRIRGPIQMVSSVLSLSFLSKVPCRRNLNLGRIWETAELQ